MKPILHALSISACLGIFASALVCEPVYAQSADPKQVTVENTGEMSLAEIQQRRNALFKIILQQPDNLDIAFEYAALSVRAGDLESAVSTLERMLIFAPGLPRLQLELGLLYYRLGAFDTSRTYLEAAISGPDVPDPVRQRVENLLAGISQATKRQAFRAEVRAGVRYQSNANQAPENDAISLNGTIFRLTPGSTATPDWNLYTAGSAHYRHDLESQGDTLEADLVFYASKQRKRDELDLAQAELTFGPGFDMGRFGIDSAALGIYGIVSGAFLADNFYSGAFGIGTRYSALITPKANFLGKIEFRHRNYVGSSVSPTADLRDGNELRIAGYLTNLITPNLLWSTGVQGQITSAQRQYLSYRDIVAFTGPIYSFASPTGKGDAWTASASVGASFRQYDGPDPVININTAQEDRELFARASLSVPTGNNWSALFETEYRAISSNYDTRNLNNFSATFSVVKKW